MFVVWDNLKLLYLHIIGMWIFALYF